jgi:hypothetical protein
MSAKSGPFQTRICDRHGTEAEVQCVLLEQSLGSGGQSGFEIDLQLRMILLSCRNNGGSTYISTVMLVPMRTRPSQPSVNLRIASRVRVLVEQVAGMFHQFFAGLGDRRALA